MNATAHCWREYRRMTRPAYATIFNKAPNYKLSLIYHYNKSKYFTHIVRKYNLLYPHSQAHQAAAASVDTPEHQLGVITHQCQDELSSPCQHSDVLICKRLYWEKLTRDRLVKKIKIKKEELDTGEYYLSYPGHYNSHLHIERLLHKQLIIARLVKETWKPCLIPNPADGPLKKRKINK